MRAARCLVAAAALAALLACVPASGAASRVRVWKIQYRAHNGVRTDAWVVLPSWYGPHRHPAIPLIISPHGRGIGGRQNAELWGSLPAAGPFAVVNPDGQGRVLGRYSWGSWGQVEDLARMPEIVTATLPWLRIDRRRIFAYGGSMGGQETLLLVARHPHLLAGAAVFDAVTDFARQYRMFPHLTCDSSCRRRWEGSMGRGLQHLAREEVGGTPSSAPLSFRLRSPLTYARALASSCVPMQFWWSNADRIVRDQREQTGKLFWEIRRLNPDAPVEEFVGFWIHSAEMRARTLLPLSLAEYGLLPPEYEALRHGLHVVRPPQAWCD